MSTPAPGYGSIFADGLWHNNAGLVQLLGLCPLLAVTNTLINGLGMGLATAAVLIGSNASAALLGPWLPREIRIAAFVLVIGCLVTVVDLGLHAWLPDLHRSLGLFIPLIVTNCAIIGRAEAFASRHDVGRAVGDGVATGIGFALVLVTLGTLRELLGQGTLLAGAQTLFGPAAADWTLHPFGDARGFLLMAMPPGAFFGLAMLVAGKNALEARRSRRPNETPVVAAQTSQA